MRKKTGERQHTLFPDKTFPYSPDQIINIQQPKLDELLELFAENYNYVLQFSGSVDVLDIFDYPLAHSVATNFLGKQSSLFKQSRFPHLKSTGLKPTDLKHTERMVQRTPLTELEAKANREHVKATRESPLCFRFLLEAKEKYLGEIFIIPVITHRTPGLVVTEKSPAIAYETLIVGVDQISKKKTAYFVILSGETLADKELMVAVINQMKKTIKSWFDDRDKVQLKKKRRK